MPTGGMFAAALALVIGFTLGALGSGGAITTLPVLVYVAGVDPRAAVAMTLGIVGAASLLGALLQWRKGNLHSKAAAVFGGAGIPGALLGTGFTHAVSPDLLMVIFAALLLVVGTVMWRGAARELSPGRCRFLRCASIGFGVGILTGFLGVGGGFLIVPALVLFAGIPARQAVGTSMAIIALNCAAGLLRQIGLVAIDWSLTLVFLAAVVAGMGIGVAATQRWNATSLNRALAGVLILTGLTVGALQAGRYL